LISNELKLSYVQMPTTGDFSWGILAEMSIQNGITNLVTHLVWK